jgi:hypothetical protein
MLIALWKLLNFQALVEAWFPRRNRREYQASTVATQYEFPRPTLNTSILPYGNDEFKEESQALRHNLAGIIVALRNEKKAFSLIELLI